MTDLTFTIFEDNAGEWRWRCRAANGEIIADSGEGYAERRDCRHGIDLLRDHAADAAVRVADDADQ